ncbi:uncharacterized protein LOC134761678 [Pongo abelii]|uniref:uncharacterized protein LOC134761678 n=1 Tax=Pongo abelii TaxID=9601 RepID=UPI0030054AAE
MMVSSFIHVPTKDKNQAPHVLTHRWELNNENTWTQEGEHHTPGPVSLAMLPRFILNSWPQVILPPWLPAALGLQELLSLQNQSHLWKVLAEAISLSTCPSGPGVMSPFSNKSFSWLAANPGFSRRTEAQSTLHLGISHRSCSLDGEMGASSSQWGHKNIGSSFI